MLDSKYRLPGGFRVGWDGILGFIPGLGDVATSGISLYILFQAAILGAPPAVLGRMLREVIVADVGIADERHADDRFFQRDGFRGDELGVQPGRGLALVRGRLEQRP
ncbi:MAG: DUF4112 domain-containing protein [Oxalobacteraceae bacterium]|nr:MAG: DUF4112 domain-containing protein [Oxalobacteraceae bacterium]